VERCRTEELCFFGEAKDRPRLPALLRKPDAGKRVCGKEAFFDRPIEEMAKDFDIAVEGRLRKLLLLVPQGAEFPHRGLRDRPNRPLAEMGQQHLEAIEMVSVTTRKTQGAE